MKAVIVARMCVHEGGGGAGGVGSDTGAGRAGARWPDLPSTSPRVRLLGHRCTNDFAFIFTAGLVMRFFVVLLCDRL